VALLAVAIAFGSVAGRPINVAAGCILGRLGAVLLQKYWLEQLSVLAVIDGDRITVVRRFGTRVQSTQAIPRDRDGRFTLSERSRFLSTNVGDRRSLRFGEHVIELPFVLASPVRAAQIRDAWNQLVEQQWAASA
jgi:hypothetical protein